MNRLLVFAALLTAAMLIAACGGNDEEEPTPTYTVPGGVNTSLPRHLTAVRPEQESTVTNEELQASEGGICASFDFRAGETMGDDPTSRVTLIVGQEDVTGSASFVVTDDFPTSSGTICYVPPNPFSAEVHTVTVRYSDATDRQFIYNWTFTVVDSAATSSP